MAISFNKGFNIQRLIKRVLWTVMALFVGGITLQYFIRAMNGTCSVFYNGLSFIGVSVGPNATGSNYYCTTTGMADANTINSPTLSTSVLSVVGVIAIAGILMTEFVRW